jgi:hypothetical protein
LAAGSAGERVDGTPPRERSLSLYSPRLGSDDRLVVDQRIVVCDACGRAYTARRRPDGTYILPTLSDPSNNRAYWQSQSPAQRLAAVEQLRQLNDDDDPAERLQRAFETAR